MHKTIQLEEIHKIPQPIYIDVRSPKEFSIGHIPGSINIPIFSDNERAEVGTIYKVTGSYEAKERGLEIVSTKLPAIVAQIKNLYNNNQPIIIYCWRGGMRSKSIVTVLNLMGIQVFQLLGGYKSYRQHVLNSLHDFKIKPKVIILCGSTGVGKTSLLNLLEEKNIPVINIEKIANHRGSVFGHIGLGEAKTAHNFDSKILMTLESFNNQPYIIVECESKRIGNIYLPDCLYHAMQTGTKVLLHTNIEIRISRLIEEYTKLDKTTDEEILNSLKNLSKRLGNKKVSQLLSFYNDGKVRDIVRILLEDYYDLLYGYEKFDPNKYNLVVNCDDLENASAKIIDYLEQLGR